MQRMEAIGVVETLFYTVAIELLDRMQKGANVLFLRKESTLGGRLVTIVVGGKIADVTEAINIVRESAEEIKPHALKNAIVIANPHQEIMKYIVSKDMVEQP